jgi:homoserine O-acetyltransferase
MTHINFADDEINPPELGITERLLKNVPSIRFLMWPYGEGSRGHGTHTAAAVWKMELVDLLRRTE